MNYEQRETATRVINSAKRNLWVTFQMPGFQRYYSSTEASLLQNNTTVVLRSLFKFKVKLSSYSATLQDTQALLNFCESLYLSGELNIDFKTIDEMSDELYLKLAERYPLKDIVI